jgi:murein DD-endopeptidase MepM/ murein hydrolase activator NlpD
MFNPISIDPVTRKTRWRLRKEAQPVESPWCWPLPRFAQRDPIALRSNDAEHRLAVDIGYSALDMDSLQFVPVYAAQDGMVRLAVESTSGYAVSLDHGGKWSTHYAHLDRMFVIPQSGRRRRRFEFVRAGSVIGYASKAPVHVRFELWNWTDDRGYVPTDPLPHLKDWAVHPTANYLENPAQTKGTETAAGARHE